MKKEWRPRFNKIPSIGEGSSLSAGLSKRKGHWLEIQGISHFLVAMRQPRSLRQMDSQGDSFVTS